MTRLKSALTMSWLSMSTFIGGCGGKDQADVTAPTAIAPGCATAPACGSCGTCFDRCFCEKGDSPTCANECASPAPMNPPPPGTSTGTPLTSPTGAPSPTPTTTGTTPPTNGPPPDTQTLTLTTDFIDVGPGAETFKCQNFANPIGKDVDFLYSESFMTPGSHHMFAFREQGLTNSPLQGCSGLEFTEFVHSAQTPQQVLSYPPGVGRYMPASDGFRILAHYLNATTSSLHAQVTVTFHYVDTNQVQAHAAQIFLNIATLYVRPGTSTVSHTYTLPYDINLLGAVSHMHKHAVGFTSQTSDGRTIYDGTDWNEPKETVFDPPMQIASGTTIGWACTYNNTTGTTLTFGESAATNEMCIFTGTFYPAPGGNGINSLF